MVTVTDSAKDLLQVMGHPAGTVLRLEPVGGKTGDIALVTGEEQDADQVVERDGADLLHVPAVVSDALDGATIDAVETPEGPRLSLTPPR
jgi:Fe-S cluster assembly iron-binding protein IscA